MHWHQVLHKKLSSLKMSWTKFYLITRYCLGEGERTPLAQTLFFADQCNKILLSYETIVFLVSFVICSFMFSKHISPC